MTGLLTDDMYRLLRSRSACQQSIVHHETPCFLKTVVVFKILAPALCKMECVALLTLVPKSSPDMSMSVIAWKDAQSALLKLNLAGRGVNGVSRA